MKVKWVCFGDEFKLECPMMNLLLIHLTSVSIPPTNSNLCAKRNETSIPCGLVPYSQSLKTECNGRQKCILKKNESDLTNAKCKQRFVVSVIYECSKFPFTLVLLFLLSGKRGLTGVQKRFPCVLLCGCCEGAVDPKLI